MFAALGASGSAWPGPRRWSLARGFAVSGCHTSTAIGPSSRDLSVWDSPPYLLRQVFEILSDPISPPGRTIEVSGLVERSNLVDTRSIADSRRSSS